MHKDNLLQLKANTAIVSKSQIQYTLITSDVSYKTNDFSFAAFKMLRTFPKDLLQMQDARRFFKFSYQTVIKKSIDLFSFPNIIFQGPPETDVKEFHDYSNYFTDGLIKVFIIDASISNHQEIGAFLKKLPFSYFTICPKVSKEIFSSYDTSRYFTDVYSLNKLLGEDLDSINEVLQSDDGVGVDNFNFDTIKELDNLNPYYPTMYTENNYFTLNQILSNFWRKEPEEVNNKREHFNEKRMYLQIEQSKVIDVLWKSIRSELRPVTYIEPYFSPLIVIAPFHFPRYKKLLKERNQSKKERDILYISQSEQTLNYSFEIDDSLVENFTHQQVAEILTDLTKELLSLDLVGYLHAQFNYSPSIRLPVMGKSLNMDLSHLQSLSRDKLAVVTKILKIGNLMREKMIESHLKEYIVNRNGQIVFISDLPMEWLVLDKFPISLTHDICRIPTFNFNGLVNHYIHNQRVNFRIKPDILKRTLIIHAASDNQENMHFVFDMFKGYQDSLGFKSIVCKTIEEISDIVNSFQPELLIFDCHGSFNEKDLSSYLIIDEKNSVFLTGADIVKYEISAPLVFVSACSTMPNYGYVKFLSDAFFEAGAFSVTATYLPIKITDAAILLIRILTGLKQLETQMIFSNWLAFISHNLRSMLIYETIKKEKAKKKLQTDPETNKIAEILANIMSFDSREKALELLAVYLQSLNPEVKTVFEDLEHEWLSYTTVGRADLIYFESWLHEHQEANVGTKH